MDNENVTKMCIDIAKALKRYCVNQGACISCPLAIANDHCALNVPCSYDIEEIINKES